MRKIKIILKRNVNFLLTPLFYFQIRKLKRANDLKKSLNFVFTNPLRNLKPLQIPSEMEGLLSIVEKSRPKTVLEIGTAKGGTLFLFSQIASEDAHLISVDLPAEKGGYPNWKIPFYKSFAKKNQKIELIKKDSHSEETFEKIRKILKDKKVDFLFIDGDHSYEGVKKDFKMYNSLVKESGLIAFHDIIKHPPEANCNVSKFWDEVKNKYKSVEIVNNKNQKWAGIGVIKIPPIKN